MAVLSVDIGTKRIWLTAYNPSDVLAEAYCLFAVQRAVETLRGVPLAEVHGWIREHVPALAPLIDHVEAGGEVPRDVPPGRYPVTPGQERFEAPILAYLKRRSFDQWIGRQGRIKPSKEA